MAHTKLVSWNVRGIRDRAKRTAVLSHIKNMRAHVVVLLETHLTGQLQLTLKKPWLGWVYQAPHTSHSRGVAVLVTKNTQFQLLTLRIDDQGRYLFLHAMLNNYEVLILAYYVPPPFQFAVLHEGLAFMAQHPAVPAIWLGDFNAVMNPALDRTTQGSRDVDPKGGTRFARLMREFALVDTWRHKFPTSLAYSCFSASHPTMSRIDYIFVSSTLLPKVANAGFGLRILSDHSPCWITLTLQTPSSSQAWRLNPFWLSVIPDIETIQDEWVYFFTANGESAPMGMVWETFKLHAKMVLSARISRYKDSSKLLLRQAEAQLESLEQAFRLDPSPDKASRVRAQTRLVNQLHFEKAKRQIFFCKQRIFEHGERAGKLLAYLAHLDHRPPVVVSLTDASGCQIVEPDLVAKEFHAFFTSLYSSRAQYSQEELVSFLDSVNFPMLSASQIKQLEAPITPDDIDEAIAHLATAKAPGTDGLPLEFYSQF